VYACTGRIVFVFGKIEKAVRRRVIVAVVVVIDCGIVAADFLIGITTIIFYISLFYTIFAAVNGSKGIVCRATSG